MPTKIPHILVNICGHSFSRWWLILWSDYNHKLILIYISYRNKYVNNFKNIY